MTYRKSNASDAGFTLVEVLISLFIFALISAGTMGAMFQTFEARERMDTALTELADLAAFRAILRADLDAMDLRPMRDGVGGTEPFLLTMRDPSDPTVLLHFTRLGRSNPTAAPRGQSERVRYALRDGQFIRETTRHANPAQRGEWRGRVLMDGIQDIKTNFRTVTSFSGGPQTNLILEDFTLPRVDANPNIEKAFKGGAISFEITLNATGNETGGEDQKTQHLFAVGGR